MKIDKYKLLPFVLFAVAMALLIANSLVTTGLTILDTDPSTYIVVPMLMLIVFPLFMIPKQIESKPVRKDLIIGSVGLAAYIILTAYIRFLFPIEALSLKTDMLMLPLAVASLAALLFGTKQIGRFKTMIIYSMFASPVILLPLFGFNLSFASINTQIVHGVLAAFVKNVVYTAPTSIAINGISISIGEACAGIGAIIGLVMLMIPVAYLYQGKQSRKVYWIISGAVLILLLNLLRMFSIAIIWTTLGLTQAASFVHSFAGILIFYISIIVMILLLGKYGLSFPKKKKATARAKRGRKNSIKYALVLAILLPLIYFGTTINFSNYTQISPISFSSIHPFNISNPGTRSFISGILSDSNHSGYSQQPEQLNNVSVAVIERNSTFSSNAIIVFVTSQRGYVNELISNNTLVASNIYVDKYGNQLTAYELVSNGTKFFVVHTSIAEQSSIDYTTLMDVFVIIPSVQPPLSLRCASDQVNTALDNIFSLNPYNTKDSQELDSAYCISESLITPPQNGSN